MCIGFRVDSSDPCLVLGVLVGFRTLSLHEIQSQIFSRNVRGSGSKTGIGQAKILESC